LKPTIQELSTRSIRRIYTIILALFWFSTALPMALSVLIRLERGMDLLQVSLIAGVYSLTIVILEVPTGGLADAIGRKVVSALAYAVLGLATLTFFFAYSFALMCVGAALYGIGRALISGALDAWFVDALLAVDPDHDLEPDLARANTVALLALGAGLLVGGAIPQFFPNLPPEGTAILTPYSVPYLFSGAIFFILYVLTRMMVVEEHRVRQGSIWQQALEETPQIIRTGLRISRSKPVILLLMSASVISGLVLTIVETFWQPHFSNLLGSAGTNTFFFGWVMGGSFLAGMAGNLLVGRLRKIFGEKTGLLCAVFHGLRGGFVLLMAVPAQLPLGIFAFWMIYFNMGVINAPHMTLMNNQIPSRQRSAILSLESLAAYLGAIVGGVVLGYIAEQFSITIVWVITGFLLIATVGLYLRVDRYPSGEQNKLKERAHV
jgi:MFS transporter, DHA1 family, quinolone resistance protein